MERAVRKEEVFTHSFLEAGGTTHHAGPHREHQVHQEAEGARGTHRHKPLLWFCRKGKAGPGEQFRIG